MQRSLEKVINTVTLSLLCNNHFRMRKNTIINNNINVVIA